MKETVIGLVIRTNAQGDNGKLLTVLTANGKRYLSVSGAKGIKSRFVSASHLFSYCEFQVEVKNQHSHVSDAALLENFYALREDLVKVALASYFCEVAGQICTESGDEAAMLSLTLNLLHVLANSDVSLGLAKAVFETRVCLIQGLTPELEACASCGEAEPEMAYLDVMNGHLLCADCLLHAAERGKDRVPVDRETTRLLLPMPNGVRALLRYLYTCPPKKIFHYRPDAENEAVLGKIAESYMQNHLECRTGSLSFYRELKQTESCDKPGKDRNETD